MNTADELLALSLRLQSMAVDSLAPEPKRRSTVVVRVRIPKSCFRLPSATRPRIAERLRSSLHSWLYQ